MMDRVQNPCNPKCYTPYSEPFRIYTPKSLLFLIPNMTTMSHGAVHQREKRELHVMSPLLLEDLDDSVCDLYYVYGGDSLLER
jgi:hypothetical protein